MKKDFVEKKKLKINEGDFSRKRIEQKKHKERDRERVNIQQANWKIESPRLSSSTKSRRRTTLKRSSLCPANPWAKNRSNDTQKKNLPNHWSEVDAPLQCVGMEIESLKEDEWWFEKR